MFYCFWIQLLICSWKNFGSHFKGFCSFKKLPDSNMTFVRHISVTSGCCSVFGPGPGRTTHNLHPPMNRCHYYSWYILLHHDQSCMLQQSAPSVLGCVLFFFVCFFPRHQLSSLAPEITSLRLIHTLSAIETSPIKSNCISAFNLAWAQPICSIATLGRHEVSKQSALVETNSIDEHTAVLLHLQPAHAFMWIKAYNCRRELAPSA